MEGVIYSYDFLLNPFPSLVSAPNLFKAFDVFASVETVPAHNILSVAVACCRYYKVLWSCTPRLSSWNHTKNWLSILCCLNTLLMGLQVSYNDESKNLRALLYIYLGWTSRVIYPISLQVYSNSVGVILHHLHSLLPSRSFTNIKKRYASYWPAVNSTGDLYAFWAASSKTNINLYISVTKKIRQVCLRDFNSNGSSLTVTNFTRHQQACV